jgi:hypothetical protein
VAPAPRSRALALTCALAPLALVAGRSAGAQGGRRAAVILELPASARALSLGDAYAAVGEDDAAIFYNPAQIATVRGQAAGLSVERYLASSTLGAASAAARLGPGTAALGVQALSYGSEPEVVPDPASGGEVGVPTGNRVSAGDVAVSVGYAVDVGALRVGAAAKVVNQRVAGSSGSAGAVDLGLAYDVGSALTVGAAVQHLGSGLRLAGVRSPLPRAARVGASVRALRGGPLALLATAEVVGVGTGAARAAGGAEVTWQAPGVLMLAGRVGATARRPGDDAGPLSVGGSLLARRIALDYAYEPYDALGGGTHRLGVQWRR